VPENEEVSKRPTLPGPGPLRTAGLSARACIDRQAWVQGELGQWLRVANETSGGPSKQLFACTL
jgi:hypothetical protein